MCYQASVCVVSDLAIVSEPFALHSDLVVHSLKIHCWTVDHTVLDIRLFFALIEEHPFVTTRTFV